DSNIKYNQQRKFNINHYRNRSQVFTTTNQSDKRANNDIVQITFANNDKVYSCPCSITICKVNVGVLNEMTTEVTEVVTTVIQSRVNNYQKSLTFLIVPHILQSRSRSIN
ncbi:hypothetical protein PV327_011138, partial [Microctonus hyperodae]